MQIPKDILAEKNYTGTRKILINDEKVRESLKELTALQKKINPILDGLQDTFKKFDATNKVIAEHQAEIKRLHDELIPDKAFYEQEMAKIKPVEDEARLIQSKVEPLIKEIVKDQLGEFEKPLHATEDESSGDIYVEVVDVLEDFIVRHRAQNK